MMEKQINEQEQKQEIQLVETQIVQAEQVERINHSLLEIAEREEEFKRFAKSYERALQLIIKNLKKDVDYGYPFEGAKKRVLLLPGAHKLRKWGNLQIEELKEEEIYRNNEFWGYKISLVLSGRYDRVKSVGFATYTEKKMWNEDKRTGEKTPKDEHFLWQMAYKRALVKAIIIYYGLSGYFTEEEYEETQTEKETFYFVPPEKLVYSHFLSPSAYEKIYYFLREGERSDEDISYFIQKLIPKRVKENLLKVALEWSKFVGEKEPQGKLTDKDLRVYVDNCRNKAIKENAVFSKMWGFIIEKVKKGKTIEEQKEKKTEETIQKTDNLLKQINEVENDDITRLFE